MPTDIKKLDISLDGIGHALSDKMLSVPVYQRSYAWEDKHVNDLYQDLFNSIRQHEDEYFIGSIVVANSDSRMEVVDGQQRLATITILIAAIRDYFFNHDDKERAQDIQTEYLASRNIRTQEINSKFKLNSSDNDFYYKAILSKPGEKEKTIQPDKESHKRLSKAYKIAQSSINNYAGTTSQPTDALLDLLEFLRDHLKVIWVQVPDHANAFTIFETLNDRGLELAISDLLKNYIFGQSQDRIEEVQKNWTAMYSLLETSENEDLIVTFIRHYWSSMYGITRERHLYYEIKKKINSKIKAIDLSFHLNANSKLYVAIVDPSNVFWADFNDDAKTHMTILNMFGMVQVRPLLLSIFSKFLKTEIQRALKLLVSVSVRFLIHGGLGGGAIETQYCERAEEITDGTINSTSELLEKMRKAIPTDAQFEISFKTATVSKSNLARYYLSVLEKFINGNSNPELIPNPDINAVNLEHILPINPDATSLINDEKHKSLFNRVGNLTLLSSKLNTEAGNSNFNLKKEIYKASAFTITNNLKEYDDWNEETINERQTNFAKVAIKAWPLKVI